MNAFNPQTEKLEFLAGDKVVQERSYQDPNGPLGGHQTVRLDKAAIGHPYVRYRDRVLELDVYPLLGDGTQEAGAPERLEVILICPRCQHELRITSDRKAIDYTPGAPVLEVEGSQPSWQVRGTISIERFQCTWESDTRAAVTGHGENLCRWRVAIDKNIARDV